MNHPELYERYVQLYNHMAESKDVDKMKLFGCVMNELMEYVLNNNVSFAEQEVDKLESMMWDSYLTKNEASEIYKNINSSNKWSYDNWERALNSMSLELESNPLYNKYALWATMNIYYSTHGETISDKILESTLQDVTTEQLVNTIYCLAVDALTKNSGFNLKNFLK